MRPLNLRGDMTRIFTVNYRCEICIRIFIMKSCSVLQNLGIEYLMNEYGDELMELDEEEHGRRS